MLLSFSACAVAAEPAGRASIIDGDTLVIHGQRIRLFGIDAPKSRQTCEAAAQTYRCGQRAALALADHIAQRPLTCEQRDVDRYGRIVAVCRAGCRGSERLARVAGLGPRLSAVLARLRR